MGSQLAAVTDSVIPADCSHKACDPSQLAVKSNPNGITNPVAAVSWDPKCRDHCQLAAVTHFVIPADCSHKACDPSQLAVKSNPNGITNPVTAASWDHKPCDCSQLESQKVVLQSTGIKEGGAAVIRLSLNLLRPLQHNQNHPADHH